MKNFGFSKLHIVNPKINFPNHKAKATSVGAYDIINEAKVFNNVEDAINSYDFVVSLSARKRDINKNIFHLNNFKKLLKKKSSNRINVWSEASGLSNKDLSYSNYILQIPTSTKFKSLNLSHSLAIICYEIYKVLNESKIKNKFKLKISSKIKNFYFS